VVVRAVDRGGRTWTLRSAKLPGPILADESRFQLGKTGKDLSITLKKARADDIWHQDEMKFSSENIWSSVDTDQAGKPSSEGLAGTPASLTQALSLKERPKASSGGGKASSDPGTSSRSRNKDAPTPDYKKLGHAFI